MLNGEAVHTNFIVFGLTRSGSNPQSTTLEASKLSITLPPMRLYDKSTIFISSQLNILLSIEFSTEWFESVETESETRCSWAYYRKEGFQLITEVVEIKQPETMHIVFSYLNYCIMILNT